MKTSLPILLSLAFIPIVCPAVESTEMYCECVPYDADLFSKDREVVSPHLELLYWTVQENALDYAQKMNRPAPSGTTYAIGKVKSANFKMDPGFRISGSYYNAPKYWEVWGQYTHFDSHGKDRGEKPKTADEFLTGTWPQIIDSPLVHAHSSISFHYNLFDILVDRMYIPNPHLRIRMVSGIGAAWIQQYWKTQYFNELHQSTTIKNHWKYIAAGIRIGLTGDWYWGNNIYLTGETYIGGYMGSYHNRSKQTASTLASPVRNSIFNDTRPAFTTRFSIGPSWQKSYCSNRVEVFSGYELNLWFNLQEAHRSTGSLSPSGEKESRISSGMIALHGLTTRLTMDF